MSWKAHDNFRILVEHEPRISSSEERALQSASLHEILEYMK